MKIRVLSLAVVSPFDVNAAPGKASTKCCQQYVVTFLTYFHNPQGKGKGACGGIAVVLDVDHHFSIGKSSISDTELMMRILAWWGTSHSTVSLLRPLRSIISRKVEVIPVTAALNTGFPSW